MVTMDDVSSDSSSDEEELDEEVGELFEDEEDEAKLLAMPEVEREAILSER
jgi:hypothetical protein